MLIEFSLSNYLSIKNKVTLSMLASNPVKELENVEEGISNVFFDHNKKYLKSAVLYGANGSGKSNILSAIRFFRRFVLSSSNDRQAESEIEVIPFLFNSNTEGLPSFFEMVFVIENIRYRYGFEVTKTQVISEWLFALNMETSSKESTFFTREYQDITVYKGFKEGKGLENRTRPNALFLSLVAQLEGEVSNKIRNWLRTNVNVISGLDDSTMTFTIDKFQANSSFRKKIIDFIRLINLGIDDIKIEETVLNELISKISPKKSKANEKIVSLIEQLNKEILEHVKKEDRKEISINTVHKKYDNSNTLIGDAILDFGLESRGTMKLIALLGPWFETIENGEVLIVDELDSRLHSKLTIELLKIFQSKINRKNAQLIFAAHDTNLLRSDLFRRDQIWFTEKDETGATDLYSLVEYKINQATSVRNDASFEKDYLIGKYGAIPYFGDIPKFLNEFAHEHQE